MQPIIAIKHFESSVPKSFDVYHFEGVSVATLSLGYTKSLRISGGYGNSIYLIELLHHERLIDEMNSPSSHLENAIHEIMRRNNLSHLFGLV